MHLETLLYMLLQSNETRPPGQVPDFELLADHAQVARVPNEWIKVPASTISHGLNDPENDNGPDRYFGWDSEKPERFITVPAFEAQARPLTNGDYAYFLEQTGQDKLPASWAAMDRVNPPEAKLQVNGNGTYLNGASPSLTNAYLNGKSVRTVYGPVPLPQALDWPISASYDELARCASWMNGRIPTAEEVRSIYNYVDINKNKHTDSILSKKISAVNGYLLSV